MGIHVKPPCVVLLDGWWLIASAIRTLGGAVEFLIDELAGQDHFGRIGGRPRAESGDEQVDGSATQFALGLGDGGQRRRGVGRQIAVVEADHGQLCRHRDRLSAGLLQTRRARPRRSPRRSPSVGRRGRAGPGLRRLRRPDPGCRTAAARAACGASPRAAPPYKPRDVRTPWSGYRSWRSADVRARPDAERRRPRRPGYRPSPRRSGMAWCGVPVPQRESRAG